MEVIFNVSDKTETVNKWILRTIAQSGESSTTMNVQRLTDSKIKIDFNYEVNLEKNHEQVKKISDDYAKVHEMFLFQCRKVFGGEIS